jgi:hypothetical protein
MWYSNFAFIPVAAATNIMQGAILVDVSIFPKGLYAAVATLGDWFFPYLQILDSTPMRLDINQPQEGSFTAKSTGSFSAPTA